MKSKGEVAKGGGEIVDRLIEMKSKGEMRDRRSKRVNWLIEIVSSIKVGEGGREIIE